MILAVDPGLTGAVALWDPARSHLHVYDMPTQLRTVSDKLRSFIAERELVALMQTMADGGVYTAFVEEVGGLPGQSAARSFQFGYGAGAVYAAMVAAGLVVERVRPQVWKTEMKAPKDKKAARARATELLPGYAHLWPLAKHDGRAEAALLALYGERVLAKRRGAQGETGYAGV